MSWKQGKTRGTIGSSARLTKTSSSIRWDSRHIVWSTGTCTYMTLFVVAAAVKFCDCTKARPSTDWGRDFALRIPVHAPGRWASPDVSANLHEALNFLTGDRWRIDFVRRKSPVRAPGQSRIDIPKGPCVIMPFSDGLDSHVVANLTEGKHGQTLVRVRLGSKPLDGRRTKRQLRHFASMPFHLSYGKLRSVEMSVRTRGFTFSLLAGVAAHLCKADEIVVPESGQGALGPALVPVGQAHADYRNHPLFTDRMEALVAALFDHKVRYVYPRLWHTKGETLAEFLRKYPDDVAWMDTRSCWQGARQVSVSGRRRQCGICAACLLRRMSVHSAGRTENRETYVWEDLSAPHFEDGAAGAFKKRKAKGAFHEYAIAGTLHLDHLSDLLRSTANRSALARQTFLLSRSLGLSEEETRTNLERMLRRHEEEWKSFVNSLGPRSFVAQWIAGG